MLEAPSLDTSRPILNGRMGLHPAAPPFTKVGKEEIIPRLGELASALAQLQ